MEFSPPLMSINEPHEDGVKRLWQACLHTKVEIATEADGPVKVIYPGRPNDDRGADYRDAVIATDRGLLAGDIEIHVRSSHWFTHRHHLDPVYNRVVLHVVFQDDAGMATCLQNGRTVPTVTLQQCAVASEGRPLSSTPVACQGYRCPAHGAVTGGALDAAGDDRFRARLAGFTGIASHDEAEQALYRGVMAGLGYTRNKQAMLELACRLPLRRLASGIMPPTQDDDCLAYYQAVLLGKAGLLPAQRRESPSCGRRDKWVATLEGFWRAESEAVTMSAGDWRCFRVRPGGLPARRIAAMSYLLLRYRKEGLLSGLVSRVAKLAAGGKYHALEAALMVAARGYWAKYLDFGLPAGKSAPALLGRERAAAIVVNVLLPFAAAWGRLDAYPGLAEKAGEIYRRYPAQPANTLERHMSRQLDIRPGLVATAKRQQGLIHIYKSYCAVGKCGECPVSK